MSSGYFPLDKHDEHYQRLRGIAQDLAAVIADHHKLAGENLTPEDAVRDGVYLGYLQVAVELIRKCLQKEA